MIVTAHQSAFLPWCGLIAKIAAADLFVQFDEVPIERHGFSNRNRILTPHGEIWLTVPVHFIGHLVKPISQIRMVPGNWKRKHLRSIELAYQNTPYFHKYFPMLKALYETDTEYLAIFNGALLNWILYELDIHVPIVQAKNLDLHGSKSDLVLDMCIKTRATKYIFGAQGYDYANVDEFNRAGIDVEFQNYKHPVYQQRQFNGPFQPNMSVLDVMFNCGPNSRAVICENQA